MGKRDKRVLGKVSMGKITSEVRVVDGEDAGLDGESNEVGEGEAMRNPTEDGDCLSLVR